MAARDVTVVDCPISGGPPGTRAGTLSVMVSGDPAAIERVRPMISLWGRTLTVAGDKPGAAQVLKLTNNILSAVALVATAEAFVMGSKAGLDPEVMLAAINAGSGRNSATLDKFPAAVLTRSFDYGAGNARTGYGLATDLGYRIGPIEPQVNGFWFNSDPKTASMLKWAAGINYFFKGHEAKIGAEFVGLINSGILPGSPNATPTLHQFIIQGQLAF